MFNKKNKIDNYSIKYGVPLVAFDEEKTVNSEQFNTIRTNIQFSNIDKKNKTLMFTSSVPSEGKSTVSNNVAISFAKQGNNVLLVDSDLRKPTVNATFKMFNTSGLSDYMTDNDLGAEDIIFQTTIRNLSVISSGPIPPNPSELISSKRMKNLINLLEKDFDLIIFDAPPILSVTDAQILSTYVEGTILVLRKGYTYKQDVVKSINLIEHVHGKLIGAILNDVPVNEDIDYAY